MQRLNKINTLIAVFVLGFALLLPCSMAEVDVGEIDINNNGIQTVKSEQASKLIQDDVRVNDLDVNPINTQNVKKDVMPDTKKEGKRVLGYFF